MKRVLFALALVLILAGPLAANDINLGNFPLGSWLDQRYQAVWEFSSGNIRILNTAGELQYDFGAEGIENFRVGAEGSGVFISFASQATGKTYKLIKPLTNTAVILEIERPGHGLYRVEMPRQ